MTERAWSEDTGQADWIGERLSPFDDYVVTSVVPGGFESYARLLHPAEEPGRGGGHLVRWAEVAAWSGLPLRGDSQFHSIALPRVRPAAAAPWSGQGPRVGGLYPPDAEVLAGILRRWTTTPERCWFCAWEDFGQGVSVRLTAAGERPAAPAAAAPEVTWNGPRVHLPDREYLLYAGSVESFVAHTHLDGDEKQTTAPAGAVSVPWAG